MESSANLPPQQRRAKTEDDGFATFYSSLTTGTMSKLSSVLAYAGLPLTAEESQQPEPAPKEKVSKDRNNRTVSAANEPDVKKYFSKAALTAIEDEHRQRGAHGQVFGPAESFYVVQKGGGTYSYADIARNQQLHNAAMEDEELFVDAQEGTHNRNSSQSSNRAAFGKSRTAEELELENTTLKTTLAAIDWMRSQNIGVSQTLAEIVIDRDVCVDCGLCTGVCPTEALTINPETFQLAFVRSRCIVCEQCIPTCPVQAISTNL